MVERAPREPEALHRAGVVAVQRGRPEKGLNLIERGITGSPHVPSFHTNLGVLLMATGRFGEAASAYRRALLLRRLEQPVDPALETYRLTTRTKLRHDGEQVTQRFPEEIGGHRLNQLWAFSCDGQVPGVRLHADFAAVNANFWITPDEANLAPERVVVPYRQNRAVLFHSDLVHASDRVSFREGHENRRINITMLFGDRRSSSG